MSANNNYFYSRFAVPLLIVLSVISCKKYVEVPPPSDKVTSKAVFANASSISSAMTGLYEFSFGSEGYSNNYAGAGADVLLALASDDAVSGNIAFNQFYTNTYPLFDYNVAPMWSAPYQVFGRVNSFIEGVSGASVITDAMKLSYIAQARLMRAYYYSLLSTLYGDVPLALNADFNTNAFLPRAPRALVDSAIIVDLLYARDHLPPGQGSDKYTFNQHTANALLARMYGYKKNWPAEEAAASAVISSGHYSLVTDLSTAFDRGNSEAIYQSPNKGTWHDGLVTVAYSTSFYISTMTPSLVNTFEAGDLRLTHWISFDGTNYAYNKYVIAPANPQEQVLIRLADVILLRAEARAEQNKLHDAIDDLNSIRHRAGVPDLPYTLTGDQVIQAMRDERRKEFFAEGITRWSDLSRWGVLQSTMAAAKPATWTAKAEFLPIMQDQLSLNPHLTQSPGY